LRNIPFGKPIIDENEKKAVLDVLNGPILLHGPKAKLFEKNFAKFTGEKYAVSVSSSTAEMHLSYFYLGTCNPKGPLLTFQKMVKRQSTTCIKPFFQKLIRDLLGCTSPFRSWAWR